MSSRRTPKGKAAAEATPPASPSRQSRRIRGVQAELDLNALEEIEKHNRRSRSRSASVSLPSHTISTPQKKATGVDAPIGSPHVDFNAEEPAVERPLPKDEEEASDASKANEEKERKKSKTFVSQAKKVSVSPAKNVSVSPAKKVSVSPANKQTVSASPSPTKKRTSVGEKPAVESDDSDDQEEEVDNVEEPTVQEPLSEDEEEDASDASEANEEEEERKSTSASPAKQRKSTADDEDEEEASDASEANDEEEEEKKSTSASPAKQRKSTADEEDEEEASDASEANEEEEEKKSTSASPAKQPKSTADEKVEDEQDEDEDDLFDDANSTMDIDEEADDEEPEEKVRRRNRLYEADAEDAAAVEQRRKKYKKSVVDDEFFRLEEMNEFLDAQDRLDAKRRLGKFDAADQMADLIDHYEAENLRPRTWELSGEVTADTRDKDTLLDNFVDADFQSKAAPTITSEITERLESIIVKRIKDKIFDDVERKQRRDELVANYRAKTAFDETVRRSLADVYEEEFEAAQIEKDADEQKMDPVVTEIKKDMDVLFSKLDALSHYQFVPSKVRPEVKIVKNVASLRAEEVGPMASTAAADALLAPEEVAAHLKAAPKAIDERDATDRNRQRRKKKQKQKALSKKGLMNKENVGGKELPNGFRIKKTIVKKGKVLVVGKMSKKRKTADATTDEN